MADGLQDYNTSEPTVDQVHGVEGDSSEPDEGVVAACQEEERNHVDGSHDTGSANELRQNSCGGLAVVDPPEAETDIGCEVSTEEESLQTTGERANVDSS